MSLLFLVLRPPLNTTKCPKVRAMTQMVMWMGLVAVGVTLGILILSTTSSNLSLSFNTNLYHFLNLNSTKSHCSPAERKELCRKTAREDPAAALTVDVENIIAPSASRLSAEGNVGNSPTSSDKDVRETEDSLAKGFSAWWQMQLKRKTLVTSVCARYLMPTQFFFPDRSDFNFEDTLNVASVAP